MLAFKGEDPVAMKALNELAREDIEYIYSSIVQLECIPKPTAHKKTEELEFYEEFFTAARKVPCLDNEQSKAMELGCNHGLSAPDALHVGCAVASKADEFITAEGITKPLGRLNNTIIEQTKFRTIRVKD